MTVTATHPDAVPAAAGASADPTATPAVDSDDGRRVWDVQEGDLLVEGLLAVERLGVGHRCETWVAWSTSLWHPVLVKLARPDQVAHPRAIATLQREVTGLVGGHPSAPRLLVDGTRSPTPHLVLELLNGSSLADVLEDGPLSEADSGSVAAQVLASLQHLHRRGLAHLDVKTENVLVVAGVPRLVDFGSTRPIGRVQPKGHPVGTLGYCAPEMEDCRPVSAAMDLYGLGTVLTECLTGQPFAAARAPRSTAAGAIAARLLDDDPRRRGEPRALLRQLAHLTDPELEGRPWPHWVDAVG